MLDPETWDRIEPSNPAVPSVDSLTSKEVEEDEEKLMLVSTIVYGYSLGDKTWGDSRCLLFKMKNRDAN